MEELRHLRDGNVVSRHRVGTTPMYVGRDASDCEVVIHDDRVSSRHLMLLRTGAGIFIEDLSKNGTSIDGAPLRGTTVVERGVRIVLAQSVELELAFGVDSPEQSSSDATAVSDVVLDALAVVRREDGSLAHRAAGEVAAMGRRHSALEWAAERFRRIAAARDNHGRLKLLVHEAMALTNAPEVWALRWERQLESDRVSFRHLAHGGTFDELPRPDAVPSSIVAEAIKEGEVWTTNATLDPRFADRESVLAADLRSVGCIALGPRSVLFVSDPSASGRFGLVVRARLKALAGLVGALLDPPDLVEQTVAVEPLPGVVGSSPCMLELTDDVRTFAETPLRILLRGEAGVGKTHIARIIHELSGAAGPFVVVDCANLSRELAGAELFGTEPGAFTGAVSRPGLVAQANGGTLFLDEVGELPREVQSSLLLLADDEPTYCRIGGRRREPFSGRIVAATNQNIDDAGAFSVALLGRLAEVVMWLPSLKQRGADVRMLADALFQRERGRFGERAESMRLSSSALDTIARMDFGGENVRGLRNVIKQSIVLALRDASSDQILPRHLRTPGSNRVPDADLSYEELVNEYKRSNLMAALDACDNNRTQVVKVLRMKSRGHLYREMTNVGLLERRPGSNPPETDKAEE